MSPEVRAHLSRTKDAYGDDYTEPTDAASLSQVTLILIVALFGQNFLRLMFRFFISDLAFTIVAGVARDGFPCE